MIYKKFIRPILFRFDPEQVHHFVITILKIVFFIPGVRYFITSLFTVTDSSIEKRVFGLKFKNPVGLAAGFDKNGDSVQNIAPFGFSFIEIGTVTPLPQPGNLKPRSFRLPDDMALINRMGMNNDGVKKIAANLRRIDPDVIIGGNIGKNTETAADKVVGDFRTSFEALYDIVDYFVLNLSCPNIGDISSLQNSGVLLQIIASLKSYAKGKPSIKPVLFKVSPDMSDSKIDELVDIALNNGIDGFVATNTTISRNGLITSAEKIESIGRGGLSGKPLQKRSTEVIKRIVRRSDGKLPVIGSGGVIDPDSAIEKLNAGATLVQVYTGFVYHGPTIVRDINRKLVRIENN